MKKTIFILSAFVTLTIATNAGNGPKAENKTISSKAVTPERSELNYTTASIVGTWKLFAVDLGMVAPKGQEKVYEDLKKDMIAKTVYTFTDAKTITMESSMGKSSGTYSISGSVLSIVVNKKTETVTIKSLTATELVLVTEDRGTKTVMKFKK
ncbi:MAG: lipocalin family protein [Bacteroidetes bacterium]|nr:lipocalin family protein [Bacteroidota bacterium]